MKFIKKISELFDTEELKDKNEIPYLTGDLKKDILSNKYKGMSSYIESIKIKFPILKYFHLKNYKLNGSDVYTYIATSKYPDNYYSQLTVSKHEGVYYLNIIFKSPTEENLLRDFILEDVEDSYKVIESFLITCSDLNIIKSKDLFSYNQN